MNKEKCKNCHDTGIVITKTGWEGNIPTKYFYIMSCHECERGTDARGHIMMHVQDAEPCDCEYRNILNYWNKRTKDDTNDKCNNEHTDGAVT